MKKTLILLCAIVLTAACKNEEKQADEIPEDIAPIDHQQAVQPGDVGDMDDIQLDQGEPWEVKPEISESIGRISELVSNYSLEATEDYKELGVELRKERQELDGVLEPDAEYSSNLQIYINSLDDKINRLEGVNSVQKGEELVRELEEQLELYSSYFL